MKHESSEPTLWKTELDWAGSDLHNSKTERGGKPTCQLHALIVTNWNQSQKVKIEALRCVITKGLNREPPSLQILRLDCPLWILKFSDLNYNTFSDCIKFCSCVFDYLYFGVLLYLFVLWRQAVFLTTVRHVAGRPVKKKSEDGNENVEKRQKKINATYSQLLDLAQVSGKLHCMVEDLNCIYTVCCLLPVMWCCRNAMHCWRTRSICMGSTESVMTLRSGLRIRSACYELMTRQMMWRLQSASLRWGIEGVCLVLLEYANGGNVSFHEAELNGMCSLGGHWRCWCNNVCHLSEAGCCVENVAPEVFWLCMGTGKA